jgi:hypothetical protein
LWTVPKAPSGSRIQLLWAHILSDPKFDDKISFFLQSFIDANFNMQMLLSNYILRAVQQVQVLSFFPVYDCMNCSLRTVHCFMFQHFAHHKWAGHYFKPYFNLSGHPVREKGGGEFHLTGKVRLLVREDFQAIFWNWKKKPVHWFLGQKLLVLDVNLTPWVCSCWQSRGAEEQDWQLSQNKSEKYCQTHCDTSVASSWQLWNWLREKIIKSIHTL